MIVDVIRKHCKRSRAILGHRIDDHCRRKKVDESFNDFINRNKVNDILLNKLLRR